MGEFRLVGKTAPERVWVYASSSDVIITDIPSVKRDIYGETYGVEIPLDELSSLIEVLVQLSDYIQKPEKMRKNLTRKHAKVN